MPQPICFIDNKRYDCGCYPEIVAAFSDYPDIFQVNNNKFQFKIVGVLSADNQPVVVFPKNYAMNVDEQELISDAKVLARVIIRYRNEGKHRAEEMKLLYGDSNMSSGRIAAAMFLLDDYCRRGYLTRQAVSVSSHKSGRIDWTATINKTQPVLSNGSPVYTTPVMLRYVTDEDNLIVLTHKYVIGECFREWGWFFGYDSVTERAVPLPASLSEVVRCLQKELRQTFMEREIQVIKCLIQYLTEKTGQEEKRAVDVMATQYFSFVWEAVCGYLMNNQYSKLKILMPQPEWESELVEGHIAQRPDVFLVKNQGLYILDAKYYNYNINIPGWHDVVKQLFYRHTMKSIAHSREFTRLLPEVREIYNAFLMPGNGDDCVYIGRVHVPGVTDLGEIKAFAINQKKAFSAYAYRNDTAFVDNLQAIVVQHFFAET